jgi:lipid A 3-O-deacylase
MSMIKRFFIMFFIALLASQNCPGEEIKRPENSNTISFYLENDTVGRTDGQYTNGFKLTWISKDLRTYREADNIPQCLCPIVDRLPFINDLAYQKNLYFSIGQNMYTPSNIHRTDLIKEDRPYAGISYMAIGFLSRNQKRMDTIEIDAGIVGPHSYAGNVQNFFHRLFKNPEANGWDNQLKDEPVLDLFFERKWRVLSSDLGNGFAYDLIPHAGFSAGNLLIAGVFGGQVRFGFNLPNDFGTLLIRPGSDTNAPVDEKDPRFSPDHSSFGAHIFFGLDASAVARNLLLDGNSFKKSHSVEKKPVVSRVFGGLGFLIGHVKITFANVWESKNFDTQKNGERYGSLTASYSF